MSHLFKKTTESSGMRGMDDDDGGDDDVAALWSLIDQTVQSLINMIARSGQEASRR
jgi:hypothetical protein